MKLSLFEVYVLPNFKTRPLKCQRNVSATLTLSLFEVYVLPSFKTRSLKCQRNVSATLTLSLFEVYVLPNFKTRPLKCQRNVSAILKLVNAMLAQICLQSIVPLLFADKHKNSLPYTNVCEAASESNAIEYSTPYYNLYTP